MHPERLFWKIASFSKNTLREIRRRPRHEQPVSAVGGFRWKRARDRPFGV